MSSPKNAKKARAEGLQLGLAPEHAFGLNEYSDNVICQAPPGLVHQIACGGSSSSTSKPSAFGAITNGGGAGSSANAPPTDKELGIHTSVLYSSGTNLVLYNYDSKQSHFLPRGPPGCLSNVGGAGSGVGAQPGTEFSSTRLPGNGVRDGPAAIVANGVPGSVGNNGGNPSLTAAATVPTVTCLCTFGGENYTPQKPVSSSSDGYYMSFSI